MFVIRTIVLEITSFVKMNESPRSGEFVTSLARGLQVICAFDTDNPAMTLSDVAKRTGLTRAAARRFLHTLRELGYVSSDGRDFRLTPRVLGLGYAYLSSMSIVELAQPFMENISKTVNESCSMSVLDDSEVVYIARVPTKRIMSVALSIGTRLPAYNTSMGRVLLAELNGEQLDSYFVRNERTQYTPQTVTDEHALRDILEQTRRAGFAAVDQELELGLRSIAVPVRARSGNTLAALNVSGHATRVSMRDMRKTFLPPLQEAAEAITATLSGKMM
jgi:IclR family pca regulon transcriptional regulator